jgi:hypothetical protein
VSESVDLLLPVLVAELADEGARKLVQALAEAREVAFVPLIDAPVDASLHVLEVTTPGQPAPLLVLAEPQGGPTEKGFPLRLHPYDSPPERTSLRAPAPDPTESAPAIPNLRATRTRPATLTKHHTRDLFGESIREPPPASNVEDLVGRELASKLVVEALVGAGGMGSVYRARHKQLGTTIAVKVLHSHFRDDLQFCARFHAEALVVSQLDHPNVVRIIDYGQEPDGLLYLAMDFLEGIELQEVLRRAGTLPLPRIIDIAMQVSAGLGHAHARGIIHRDVKPSNIVLVKSDDDEGETVDLAKVCDFGIAARTGTSDLLGTPAYMSPEQCAGKEVDGRSDVYSLGVILYELATGQLPFAADDEKQVLAMQQHGAPPRPSSVRNVDARLETLILRMLAKSPDERPQSMRDLRNDLRDLTRPPSLQLHDVGTGRDARGSKPPDQADHAAAAVAVSDSQTPGPAPALSVSRMEAAPDIRGLAAQLAREPVSTLREKLATPERFVAQAQALAAAMRLLLDQRELAPLAHVVAILCKVASDGANDPRAELAARLVKTLQDPARLAPVAEHALAEHDDAAPALLASLGLAAAHALYAARIRAHHTPPLRARFVAALRGIGLAAWPLVSAALLRNAPGDAVQHDHRLAEDLLRAMPLVADDACGGVVAKYLRWGDGPVRRAAIAPLVALWGDRTRPLLLAVLLKDSDEGARVAAIRGLRDLRAVDDHVIRKAEDMLAENGLSNAVRIALAEALGDARDDARPIAIAALRRVLSPKGGFFGRQRAPIAPGPVVLSLAVSYVAIGGPEAAKLVAEVGRHSEEPLRTQLLGLVGSASRA